MTLILQRLVSAAILMIWGSVLCAIYFSGRVTSYLHPTFQPLTAVCGCALVLLAVLVLVAPGGGDAAHATASTGSPWKKALGVLMLLIPLFVALATSKDSFGASTVMNRNYVEDVAQLPGGAPASAPSNTPDAPLPTNDSSSASPANTASTPAVSDGEGDAQTEVVKNKKGEIKAEVIDFLYAAQLPDMRSTFEDKQIEVIGQLMPAKENNPNGNRYDLVRMFMTCCAADVQPIALPIHPGAKPNQPDMTWVKVSGKATFPVIGGQRHPLIENATVEKTDPPEDTYLY